MMEQIPKIEGANIEDGLKRVRNNLQLYKKLLNSFFNNNMVALLAQNTHQNDAKAARIQAHSIKGASANLGLDMINRVATKIDNILKTDDAKITPECIELANELVRLTAETKDKVDKLDW